MGKLVGFLLGQIECLKKSKIDVSEFKPPPGMTPYSKELLEEGKKYYGTIRIPDNPPPL